MIHFIMTVNILSPLESFGRFHVAMLLMLSMQMMLLGFNNLSMVFYHDSPPHHCKVTEGTWLNQSLPEAEEPTEDQPFSSCLKYKDPTNHSLGTETCQQYQYNTSIDGSTVASEFDVVCDRKYLSSLINTLYFCGMVLGDGAFGPLADRFGRKPLILIGMYCQIAISFGLYFVNHLNLYIALRILLGFMTEGIFGTSLTMIMEYSPTHLRGHASTVFSVFWTFGAFYVGTSAYLLRDWRYIQLSLTIPYVFSCIYLWFLPESVRWLLSKNRIDEAIQTSNRFARLNGTKIYANQEKKMDTSESQPLTSTRVSRVYTYLDLVRTGQMRRRVLILVVIWFLMAFCYYGIIFSTKSLTGNKFANFLIGIALEFVSYCATITVVGRIRRRVFFILTIISGGVLCLVGVILQRIETEGAVGITALILILLSKAMLVSSFVIAKAFTPELIPTVVRNMGMAMSLLTCRVGALVAPQIVFLGEYTDSLVPFIIYGVMFLVGGLLAYFLPETKDTVIPETIQDVENTLNPETIPVDNVKKYSSTDEKK